MLNCSLRACIRQAVTSQSNKGYPGVWGFRLEREAVEDFGCMKTGPLAIVDAVGPVLGGKPVQLTGPCLEGARDHLLRCRVGRKVMPGRRLGHYSHSDVYKVECVPPLVLQTGIVSLALSVDGGRTYPFTTNYTYVLGDLSHAVMQENPTTWDTPTTEGTITWDVGILPSPYVTVEFLIIFPSGTDRVTTQAVQLTTADTRWSPGKAELPRGLPDIDTIPPLTSFGPIRLFDHHEQSEDLRVTLYSTPQWSLWFFHQWIIELIYRSTNQQHLITTPESDRVWGLLQPHLQSPSAVQALGSYPGRDTIASFMASGGLGTFTKSFFARLCDRWVSGDQTPPPSALSPAPCTADQARADPNFVTDSTCGSRGAPCRYRPNAATCVLAAKPSPQSYGQRVCYGPTNQLVPPSDRRSTGAIQRFHQTLWFSNQWSDERGHAHCCVYSDTCKKWAELRPGKSCNGHDQGSTGSSGTSGGQKQPGGQGNEGGQGTHDTVVPAHTTSPPVPTTPPGPVLELSHNMGPILGGNPVIVTLPVPARSEPICRFGEKVVPGVFEATDKVRCISPMSFSTMIVNVQVSVDNGHTFLPDIGRYKYDPLDKEYQVRRLSVPVWENATQRPLVTWDINIFSPPYVNIDFVMFFPSNEPNAPPTQESVPIVIIEPLLHHQLLSLPLGLRYVTTMPTLTTFGALRVLNPTDQHQPTTRVTLWSDPFWSKWFFHQYLIELVFRQRTLAPVQMTGESTAIWAELEPLLKDIPIASRQDVAKVISGGALSTWTNDKFYGLCTDWATGEETGTLDFSDLPPVPCNEEEAQRDHYGYARDSLCLPDEPCMFRSKAHSCYVKTSASVNGHGERACYDKKGELLTEAGTTSAGSMWRWFPGDNWFQHEFFDARGHVHCCAWGSSCDRYATYRPTRSCVGYIPVLISPKPFSMMSMVTMGLAGLVFGFIMALLIACLGLPSRRANKEHHNNMASVASTATRNKTKQKAIPRTKTKTKTTKTKKEKPPKAIKSSKKSSRKNNRDSAGENYYVEPETHGHPYVNNKRRSHDSKRSRGNRSSGGAEYADFNDDDYYNSDERRDYDDRNRRNYDDRDRRDNDDRDRRDARASTADSMYSDANRSSRDGNRKRDSRISDRSSNSRRSEGSRKSNNSNRSRRSENPYRGPSNRYRISEESGDSDGFRERGRGSAKGGALGNSDDGYYDDNDRGYGINPSSANMMF